ncbi:MAG: BamA/TamA family outer membrane protein [Gemmatimonadota bacterium]|nr:MAG: BamA/TamA family outer membrane protein [Gemmatimonadota bacterium]
MVKRSLIILIFFSSALITHAGAPNSYWQQSVDYAIDVTLIPETHILTGDETIIYRNNSPDTLKSIYLHLYPNAFRSEKTTFMEERRRFNNFNLRKFPEENRGHIDIADFRIDDRSVPFTVDETVLLAKLPQSLPPDGSMTIHFSFVEKVREKFGRAGYRRQHYDFAQWYPKMVVYDEEGWHPEKFHAMGEFYGEFGTFDVSITIPEKYVIAATGECTGGDPGWGQEKNLAKAEATTDTLADSVVEYEKGEIVYKTVTFRAENVHDFAWCADPDFVVQDTTWNGISVRSFYRRWNTAWEDTNLAYGLSAVQWLSEKFGPFPYPQVSIVDVPYGWGMEYPMLIMNGYLDEGLVLHEMGHIYFYGILANNELDEAWMDEGFTVFQERWYMEMKYGSYGKTSDRNWYENLLSKMTAREQNLRHLLNLAREGYWETVVLPSYEFKHSGWSMVYDKAAFFLEMLRYIVGEPVFNKIMRTYLEDWKFKHVTEERFRAVCERVSGMDLEWFFDQWLHTTKTCDYAITEVETYWTWERAVKIYWTTVTTRRLGDIVMPIDVYLRLTDGTERVKRLEGRNIEETVSFQTDVQPTSASINPDNEILDLNMINNHRPWKTHIQPDLPNMSYYPQDAYLFKYRPWVWYNTVDGVKVGWLLKGSYAENYSKFSLGYWYGAKSARNDFRFEGSTPVVGLGSRTMGGLRINKMEGRVEVEAYVEKNVRRYRYYPPDIIIGTAFTHLELRDDRYVDPMEWGKGRVDKITIGVSTNPRADIFWSDLKIQGATALKMLGSDHEFNTIRCDCNLKTRFRRHNFRLRIFGGFASSGVPVQERFSLAGAGPIRRFREFHLRSRDALPDDLNYHLGGDGNLRGYLEGNIGLRKLFAVNLEYHSPYTLPGWTEYIEQYTSISLRTIAFLDLGKIGDEDMSSLLDADILYDAGIGLRLKRDTVFGEINLRADFPLYVNKPSLNGEDSELELRWLISFSESF